MYRPSIRKLATAGTLALIVLAPAAACSSEPVPPLPAQAASQPAADAPGGTPAATAGTSRPGTNPPPRVQNHPAGPKPTTSHTNSPPRPTPTPTCRDDRYDLDLHNTVLELVRPMCFRTGGTLRLQGIGPGLVTAEPTSLVEQNYEGGVVDLTFVRPGTVTVTIPQDEQVYTITVVVRR
ncbi:MAG TPA: hypothetical protein VFR35_09705 [Actinoplanes sp.]|nr:hypothetical protein [Actinoplanes sp.]